VTTPWRETPCTDWPNRRDKDGYGKAWRDGRWWLAHRAAWADASGPIPNDLHVLHHCDNPPCVNVQHLFLGTQADNMADKVAKGRQPRGEEHGSAKLTAAEVAEIRGRYVKGWHPTQRELAAEYGVGQTLIGYIVNGERWRVVR
jgi:hypothetical protein